MRAGCGPALRAGGFTLLEMLVALAIMAALLAGLAQGMQFGMRAWNTEIGVVARNADLDTADRSLRSLMTGMEPPMAADRPSLTGEAHSVQFLADLPPAAPVRWSHVASATVEVDHGVLVLRWSEQPHAKLIGAPPPMHVETLLPGVTGVDFSYRGPDGTWGRRWTTPDLPLLVKIHLAFPPAGHRHWPDIVVAPMRESLNETGN